MRLLLIDGLNLVRRVYAAQPGEDGPERAEGALVACLQSLRRAIVESAPTHAACVFDGKGETWRHELHGGYKAGHAPMPAALESALDDYREAFAAEGIRSLSLPGHEADDVVATMAAKGRSADVEVTILSTDHGFLQLLPLGVVVRDHFRGENRTEKDVVAKYGVRAERLVDLMALCGDRANGVPGIPGIGAKTAARLLGGHRSLEELLEASGEIAGRAGERLREHAEAARLSLRLVTLRTDLEIGVSLAALRYGPGGS